MKIKKKIGGGGSRGGGRGFRVEVNEELKFWENSQKKNWGGGWGRGSVLGGGGGGQGGCERRIEVFVKIQGCEQRIEVFVKI